MNSLRALVFTLALLGALTLQSSRSAVAAPLSPFGTQLPAVGELEPIAGSVEATMTTIFSSPTFSGTLTSTVLSGDTSNPFGGLTFTFLLSNDLVSPHPLGRLTLNGWDGWLTDVSFALDSTGVRPAIANRPVADVIGFTFMDIIGEGLVPAGKSSKLLVIQTDGPDFVENLASVIDGSVAITPSYSPVPEPATMGILLVGAAAFFTRRKR